MVKHPVFKLVASSGIFIVEINDKKRGTQQPGLIDHRLFCFSTCLIFMEIVKKIACVKVQTNVSNI